MCIYGQVDIVPVNICWTCNAESYVSSPVLVEILGSLTNLVQNFGSLQAPQFLACLFLLCPYQTGIARKNVQLRLVDYYWQSHPTLYMYMYMYILYTY